MKKFFVASSVIIIGIIFAINFLIYKEPKVEADSATTSVQIQNVVPAITAGPAESTASTAAAPTAIGGTVTFQATATDANTDQ